ncbi:uracil DNA glycosylase [Dimargaris xerosporica]|nr:uracil DNA glycosylase [Dimargaris xerosporica]
MMSQDAPAPKKRPRTLNDFFTAKSSPAKKQKDSSSPATASTDTQQPATLRTIRAAPEPTSETRSEAARDKLYQRLTPEQQKLLALEYETMDASWFRVLFPELTKPYFLTLKKFLAEEKARGQTIFPPEPDIYCWSRFSPTSRVEVVILGQDPYHNHNQAHGLCFSVNKGFPIPPSLVNIYTALQKDYADFERPKHGHLVAWAKQGVLLLNAALTVRAHQANSHSGKGWEKLTDAVVEYINERKSNVVFMLWGASAQKKGSRIDKKKHLVLKSVHPSPLSAHRGFFDCHHFRQANEYLTKHGKAPINWNCLKDE